MVLGFVLESLGLDIGISRLLLTFLLQCVLFSFLSPASIDSLNPIRLPNSRKSESEADFIGLRLTSKACFDPRESPKYATPSLSLFLRLMTLLPIECGPGCPPQTPQTNRALGVLRTLTSCEEARLLDLISKLTSLTSPKSGQLTRPIPSASRRLSRGCPRLVPAPRSLLRLLI